MLSVGWLVDWRRLKCPKVLSWLIFRCAFGFLTNARFLTVWSNVALVAFGHLACLRVTLVPWRRLLRRTNTSNKYTFQYETHCLSTFSTTVSVKETEFYKCVYQILSRSYGYWWLPSLFGWGAAKFRNYNFFGKSPYGSCQFFVSIWSSLSFLILSSDDLIHFLIQCMMHYYTMWYLLYALYIPVYECCTSTTISEVDIDTHYIFTYCYSSVIS